MRPRPRRASARSKAASPRRCTTARATRSAASCSTSCSRRSATSRAASRSCSARTAASCSRSCRTRARRCRRARRAILRAHAERYLPGAPFSIEIVDDIPLTSAGKRKVVVVEHEAGLCLRRARSARRRDRLSRRGQDDAASIGCSRAARRAMRRAKLGVIVNELGEVGIDGALLGGDARAPDRAAGRLRVLRARRRARPHADRARRAQPRARGDRARDDRRRRAAADRVGGARASRSRRSVRLAAVVTRRRRRPTSARRVPVSVAVDAQVAYADVLLVTKAELAGEPRPRPRSRRRSEHRASRASSARHDRRARGVARAGCSPIRAARARGRRRPQTSRARALSACRQSCTWDRQRCRSTSAERVDLEELEDQLAELPANYVRIKGIVDDGDGAWFAVHRVGLRVSSEPLPAPAQICRDGRLVALGHAISRAAKLAIASTRRAREHDVRARHPSLLLARTIMVRRSHSSSLIAALQPATRSRCSPGRRRRLQPQGPARRGRQVRRRRPHARGVRRARAAPSPRCARGWTRGRAARPSCKLIVLALAPVQATQAKPIASSSTRSRSPCGRRCSRRRSRPTRCSWSAIRRRPSSCRSPARITGAVPRAPVRRSARARVQARRSRDAGPGDRGARAPPRHRARAQRDHRVPARARRGADPGWHQAVARWESARSHAPPSSIVDVERTADPDNWPVAGAAAEDDPGFPRPSCRRAASSSSAATATARTSSASTCSASCAARRRDRAPSPPRHDARAGPRGPLRRAQGRRTRVAVDRPRAVLSVSPRAYWVADGYGLRANLRPTDSLQLLLHAIDEVAGPGTVARVDD